ncbi:uncharacterized protein LACBIDRAFT_296227 [Laccaria bicolor S238N-H82]|uniref:Predicted protein n=1 Tax=Laccaria bicolor (strain S238N-H82 / ATCC MYA-4686) TaxID=486041 RepID=B0D899_LACBS|nr:uncharacterized protein LACBIDRAFT_296227 [Laccaria bicolor S238N-H82]EDR08797.1 predicted protein [Laccaria bicolor S238N-H82]|eukprot:XP_001880110.1 predicted protein [Laccaria bicolor S238N-H82]
MTVDFFSGNVSKIRVQDQEFSVIKHIYSSTTLFGRGTHTFLVRDKDGNSHILKDAWLIANQGMSEIDILSSISDKLRADLSPDAQKFHSIHPRFIVGEEIGDSTQKQRGRLPDPPLEHLHRRVVTGPVGDTLTSFRSREELVKVLLDCVDWLEFLHKKCEMVHGDISVNNIVIYRSPLPHSPPKDQPLVRTTQASVVTTHAAFMPAPTEGVMEDLPVSGIVIDYDYARKIGTTTGKITGTLPFMSLASLDKNNHGSYVHNPAHDLESLLYTALGIVTFTSGPCGQLRSPNDHVPLARWYNQIDIEQLRKDKAIDLMHCDSEIIKYIPDYWQPFLPYLSRLVKAT